MVRLVDRARVVAVRVLVVVVVWSAGAYLIWTALHY